MVSHFRNNVVIFGCTTTVNFHNVIAVFQMNSQNWYSDAYFTRRQIHFIRKDVRFTLKGRRNNNKNYSLSDSHAMIAFENI